MNDRKRAGLQALVTMLLISSGCAPRVALEAPKEPIVINMNVKIEHEIRIRVDKDLDSMFENEDLF